MVICAHVQKTSYCGGYKLELEHTLSENFTGETGRSVMEIIKRGILLESKRKIKLNMVINQYIHVRDLSKHLI